MFSKHSTPDEIVVAPLTRAKRAWLFRLLFLVFVVSVPLFVFHAIGYRYDFFAAERSIVLTGALYITVPDETAQIYVNEMPVRDARVFRRASYIQQLTPGVQRVHVSAPGLHTWVKELPVYPYIVTEAETFLLPVRPQLRLVTTLIDELTDNPLLTAEQLEFINETASTSMSVSLVTLATTTPARGATATTSPALPRGAQSNPEFTVFEERFAAVSTSSTTMVDRALSTARETFGFETMPAATTSDTQASTSVATTTRVKGALTVFERADDVFVAYTGNLRDIPYYFCVPQMGLASTSEVYGVHVMQGVQNVLAVTESEMISESDANNRVCRQEILIDRQGAEVYSFDFLTVGSGAVLMHRADGIFVTEIDDRSWQNTQKVYGATAVAVQVDNNRVYVQDEQGFFAELLLTLLTPNNSV